MAGGLELHGLRRCFGDLVAIDDVGFPVPNGAMVGFVGRNGAGKTTTMRIVCGLLAADAGTVTWGGRPVDARARERIGYMPEERGLYPKMRLADELEYFAVLHGASHVEGRSAAHRWLGRFGLGAHTGARVDELSHGNQQRVQLAAALVHRPDLLVLDEPFSGLDPIATDAMADVLREEAARGVAIILSSHQLELVERLCDAVAIIDRGRMVACGGVDVLGANWADAIEGAEVIERDDGRTVLALEPGADPQRILDTARRAGAVSYFAELRPSLAELFRQVVSS